MANRTNLLALVGSATIAAAIACGPKDVHDAEARGDVAFLEKSSAAESTAALGRLAAKDPKALALVDARAREGDVNAYIAAWQGHTRGESWPAPLFLPRKDPKTIEFLPDLEAAMGRAPSPSDAARLAALLTSFGAPSKAVVLRALAKPKSRTAMCQALASPDASPEALAAFRGAPPEHRDDVECASLAAKRSETDDDMATWLGQEAESGLLVAASKRGLPCPRATFVWEKALAARPLEAHAPLTGELTSTIVRCADTMDAALPKTMATSEAARAWVVAALDPDDRNLTRLPKTCVAMKAVAAGGPGTSVRTRERARDTVARGCDKVLGAAQPPR
jgi:hypothetical protein